MASTRILIRSYMNPPFNKAEKVRKPGHFFFIKKPLHFFIKKANVLFVKLIKMYIFLHLKYNIAKAIRVAAISCLLAALH